MSSLFDFSNLFVLPFWTVMILLPNWSITRKVMESTIPFVVLALIYIFCFYKSVNPETAAALANPKLADIARFFSDENAAATGWVHFLLMDLFVGRWIYWEGQKKGIITTHSLILCLFAGPIGVLSHILTVAIRGLWLKSKEGEVELSTEGAKIEKD
jgi:hypothetical protein